MAKIQTDNPQVMGFELSAYKPQPLGHQAA